MADRTFSLRIVMALALFATWTRPASAQIDPLLLMKTEPPNVVFLVDTSNRMQRDAPTDTTDATTARSTSTYYDPFIYAKTGAAYEATLGITSLNSSAGYRRKYVNLSYASSGSDNKYAADQIVAVGDLDSGYARFGAATRLSIMRAAIYQSIVENKNVVRFGLVQMRQNTPAMPTVAGTTDKAAVTLAAQQTPTDVTGSVNGRWYITRPTVAASNGSQTSTQAVVIKADSSSANTDVLNKVAMDIRGGWQGVGSAPGSLPTPLIPAGVDDTNTFDTPVNAMLTDAKTEVSRLISISNDPTCRNTIVVMIVGGGEGTTGGATNASLATTASGFTSIASRRVPIYVIALAPPASDVTSLKAIATNSGGQYFEITKAQIDAALASPLQQGTGGVLAPKGLVVVPEVVNAIDTAVQHTFAASGDFNATPAVPRVTAADVPVGTVTEYQVTSPIVSTVNLNNAKDINGADLYTPATQPPMVRDKSNAVIPQRNNMLVTTGVAVPGFDGKLRAYLVYKPVADSTQPSGWKFTSAGAGTRLWVAQTPSDTTMRNLYTSDASGNMIAFTAANVTALAPLMGIADTTDATAIINNVRSLGIGAVFDSTPAFLNAPSLDPPPDDAYPGFAVANKDRRTLIWVGTNRGVIEAIDARTGIEVWGFIPLNLLPKLRTLRDGQPVGNFDFFADGSAKISDVKLTGICGTDRPSDCWRTHVIIGEGAGGAFYQSFDVTMTGLSSCIAPDDDTQTTLLNCFNSTSRISLNWAFPSYTSFDPTLSVAVHCDAVTDACDSMPYGDLRSTATTIEKSVGQTWSDPAVGQVQSASGPYSVLIGSGFLPYATQQQTNRGGPANGVRAGTTFYILDAKTGTVYASSDVGADGLNETVNNCMSNATGCKQLKNALQTDPVATGPSDQRFITKAYLGDLDGSLWRFDIALDASANPSIVAKNKLYSAGSDQPIVNSMATVNVGGVNQYVFFGTGGDLLPGTDKNTVYHLLGILDVGGTSGAKSVDYPLAKTTSLTSDERVTAFPAVAGDIVFFTTTTLDSASPKCTAPNANLYAFTFIGGAAYDTNNDGKFTSSDSVLVKTIAGQRATAPFIVDQHLMFGNGTNVSMFGNPDDFNNGVGQAGVRILSWREVR